MSCVQSSVYAPYFSRVERLLDLANQSLIRQQAQHHIIKELGQILEDEFANMVHLLHVTMFVARSLERQDERPAVVTMTPVTDALNAVIGETDVQTALHLLPTTITDVLTAHPVDMDRGLVVTHKQRFEAFSREWSKAKLSYSRMAISDEKLAVRTRLNLLHRRLKNRIVLLLNTPNYRAIQIKPESEQRHLSRAVKLYEAGIVAHWEKLVGVVQEVFLAHMGESPEQHEYYNEVMALSQRLRYVLEMWRGDMDGNPNVNAVTMAQSMAYGRKRSFERLSADDAVVRYRVNSDAFRALEHDVETRLDGVVDSGQEAWRDYVRERRLAGWEPVQIYSGLAYYWLVEMTEAAEQFSRKPDDFSLLKVGFETASDFLAFTALLENVEDLVGISSGVWRSCRQRVILRGLSLGHPHIRMGESYHVQLIDEYCQAVCPNVFGETGFSGATLNEKRDFLTAFSGQGYPLLAEVVGELTESKGLSERYIQMMELAADARFIQSDSGSEVGDVGVSILLLKVISSLIGHTGDVAVLCEDEASMRGGIALMADANSDALLKGVIMMCAGSDNQKKMGPFYSAYLNRLFLDSAIRGVPAFFGVGDSPLRSSTHDPFCVFKTFQPGSRKTHFFGERVYRYLSGRLATQITESFRVRTGSSESDARVFELFARTMFQAYGEHIGDNPDLPQRIKAIADIATTYFSRPAKKGHKPGPVLEQIRAIDSGRAQLILNTFDPQLAGFRDGLTSFLAQAKKAGISVSAIHHFFNHHVAGNAMLQAIAYFATMQDDDLIVSNGLSSVSAADLRWGYHALSGTRLTHHTDLQLRLARLVWHHIHHSQAAEDIQARTLLLFGANWMV